MFALSFSKESFIFPSITSSLKFSPTSSLGLPQNIICKRYSTNTELQFFY